MLSEERIRLLLNRVKSRRVSAEFGRTVEIVDGLDDDVAGPAEQGCLASGSLGGPGEAVDRELVGDFFDLIAAVLAGRLADLRPTGLPPA